MRTIDRLLILINAVTIVVGAIWALYSGGTGVYFLVASAGDFEKLIVGSLSIVFALPGVALVFIASWTIEGIRGRTGPPTQRGFEITSSMNPPLEQRNGNR